MTQYTQGETDSFALLKFGCNYFEVAYGQNCKNRSKLNIVFFIIRLFQLLED